jgi:hypothetical protein
VTALQILGQLTPCLEQAGIQFWVGGSIASSVWGDPRQTNHIDIAVLRDSIDEQRLRAGLPEKFLIGPTEIAEALADRGEYPSFQILDMDEAFKFDMFVVRSDPYIEAEASRVRVTEVLPGVHVPLSAPEDIVLHKIRWFVSGGKVSDRQWNDIVRVLESQMGRLDLAYLKKWADHFDIAELLTSAFDQALE